MGSSKLISHTVYFEGSVGDRFRTKIEVSINCQKKVNSIPMSESIYPNLKSNNFPGRLNVSLNARATISEWYDALDVSEDDVLLVSIDGDPMFAFYIVKDLLEKRINFNVEVVVKSVTHHDHLADKFRQFVEEVAEKDFSNLSSSNTIDYPISFINCQDSSCNHAPKNYLESTEKFLAISIVIPTRNIPDSWLENLLFLINEQLSIEDEVIIINDNDAETDYTFLSTLIQNLRIIPGKKEGVSEARNLGVKNSRNELILFIDSDDEINPGFIGSQREFHMKFGNVSATGYWLQAFGSHNRIYPQWDGFSPLGVFQCLPPAGVLMWKKEALVHLGEFGFEFFRGFEDFDLVARAITMNHLIVVIDEVKYMYRRGHVSLSQSLSSTDQTELFQLVWRNAKSLCDSHFIQFLEIGLKHGERLYFDSINYIFLGRKKVRILSNLARKARNNNFARHAWALLPMNVRRTIFSFAIRH
jgi:glycosyltransferase involved in cell wall biosynthesis